MLVGEPRGAAGAFNLAVDGVLRDGKAAPRHGRSVPGRGTDMLPAVNRRPSAKCSPTRWRKASSGKVTPSGDKSKAWQHPELSPPVADRLAAPRT